MIEPSTFLLADPSACLRRLVLLELLGRGPGDLEVQELSRLVGDDPAVKELVQSQKEDGSWDPGSLGSGWGRGNRILVSGAALKRLGYMGCTSEFPTVRKGVEFLFHEQQPDGS